MFTNQKNSSLDDDYNKRAKLIEEEKLKKFELGIPFVYSDEEGKYLFKEYKTGFVEIFRLDDMDRVLIKTVRLEELDECLQSL